MMKASGQPSLFEQATQVFDGWTDPTGMRVLCLYNRGDDAAEQIWETQYHHFRCFIEDGRKVVLSHGAVPDVGAAGYLLLDLATGETTHPFPAGLDVTEVNNDTQIACVLDRRPGRQRALLWDMRAACEVASIRVNGWDLDSCSTLLSDGLRGIAFFSRGTPYDGPVRSRHYLLCADQPPRIVLDTDDCFCPHIQGCPTDPDLYVYDRWPSPARYVDQVMHLRKLDGTFDQPVPLAEEAMRPATLGGARDHYLWTPDGNRIVSYLTPHAFEIGPDFNHYDLEWWLSATDWRTGEDLAAKYPPGRWGGHMQVTPDSRYIVCAGAPGFDNLFAVEIETLRHSWNEHIIASYPTTTAFSPRGPFAYPFVLPDQSGVIFNAGWPGEKHGVYLAEWPSELS
jgi:hypothetical protein|tara:strand:+ start:8062 stop:9249 length:1188 start_codon:yes stop_codon:yes gene_type:complete